MKATVNFAAFLIDQKRAYVFSVERFVNSHETLSKYIHDKAFQFKGS